MVHSKQEKKLKIKKGSFTRKEIRKRAKDFVESRLNANHLVEVYKNLQHVKGDKSWIVSVQALETMLIHAFTQATKQNSEAEQQYSKWVSQNYTSVLKVLLSTLQNKSASQEVKVQALETCLKLLRAESQFINEPPEGSELCLPPAKFTCLVKCLVKHGNPALRTTFSEFSRLHDVALQTWACAAELVEPGGLVMSGQRCNNLLELLLVTAVPSTKARQKQPDLLLLPERSDSIPEKKVQRKLTRSMERLWAQIKHWPQDSLRLRLLLVLDKLMDQLSSPILLTDFFMDSLDSGGAVSVLALQGIFNLIQKHNIDCPDIYSRLYCLFTPAIFSTKFKARLFYLADLFLTSTHLPQAIVASFAKRLARLCLLAPAPDVLVMLPFIGNLLIRHKGLHVLAQHPVGGTVDTDPFLSTVTDPMLTNAMDSSLWEVKTLQSHVLPSVAIAARFIDEKMPTVEWDLADALEGTYSEMFNKEVNKKAKELTLTFIRPDTEKLTTNHPHDLPIAVSGSL